LYTLSNYENLLDLAVQKQYITEDQQSTLLEWNESPSTWGQEEE
jgi:orotate phosphoribosyltransferase